jgi:serine protease Do
MPVLEELSSAARSVLAGLSNAVVTIGTDGRGSGLVIGTGKVLTNAHNLRDRTTLVTFADGRSEQGSVAGADEDGDLVVLDVDTGSATPAAWAEQVPAEGDVVFALSRAGIGRASRSAWCRRSTWRSTARAAVRCTAGSNTLPRSCAVRRVVR